MSSLDFVPSAGELRTESGDRLVRNHRLQNLSTQRVMERRAPSLLRILLLKPWVYAEHRWRVTISGCFVKIIYRRLDLLVNAHISNNSEICGASTPITQSMTVTPPLPWYSQSCRIIVSWFNSEVWSNGHKGPQGIGVKDHFADHRLHDTENDFMEVNPHGHMIEWHRPRA